jgi:hypothetical protein
MERTDLLGTSLDKHKERVRMLRDKGPEWRIRKTFELIDWSRAMFPEQTRQAIVACKRQK